MKEYYGRYIRNVLVPQVRYLAEHGLEKAIGAFDNAAEEANGIADAAFARYGQLPGEDDLGGLAEMAQEEGLEHYMALTSVAQALRNLLAAGVYHLHEQQRAVIDELSDRAGIDRVNFDTLASAGKLKEARLVANVVKHGEGASANQLRELRPDLFAINAFGAALGRVSKDVRVTTPLAGDSLIVSSDDVRSYMHAAIDALEETATQFSVAA